MTSPTASVKLEHKQTEDRRSAILPSWLRNRTGLLVGLTIVFGLLGNLTLAFEIGRLFGGYVTYGFIDSRLNFVIHETPVWWPALDGERLLVGDKLLTINGLPYKANMWAEMARAYRGQQLVALEVNRDGEPNPIPIRIRPRPFTLTNYLDLKVPEVLVATAFWLLALVVLKARPDSRLNQIFALAAAAVAVHRSTQITSVAMVDSFLPNIPKVAHMLAAGLLPPLIFHMALIFPVPVRQMPNRLLKLYYALSILCGVILSLTRLPQWAAVTETLSHRIDETTYLILILLFIVSLVTLFARMLWLGLVRKDSRRRERRVVRIVLVGLIIALPPVLVLVVTALPFLGSRTSSFFANFDLRYLMLAIPIAFAYTIIRYQTFQSPSRLFMFVIVLSTSAILAAFGVVVVGFLYSAGVSSPIRPPFIPLFTFIFIASLFWSTQAEWRGWFGRFLNREEGNYESARTFGSRIVGHLDMDELPGTIAQTLVDEFGLECAAVWLWRPSLKAYELAAIAGEVRPACPERLTPTGAPLTGHQSMSLYARSTPEWLRPQMELCRLEVMVPMSAEGEAIGLLGLGRRWDEEIFDERDLNVAALVGQQAGLVSLAATQVDELRRVPSIVVEAQERERHRLAGELHDTIQQFLGRLPFYLAASRDRMNSDRERAAAIIDRCISDVEEAAGVLREIRANLAPNQLVQSLVRPLAGLVQHVEQRYEVPVSLSAPDGLDETTTIGTRHVLYRVIQQAIDNSVTHGKPSEISVTLGRENGQVTFAVADNGSGFNSEALDQARAQGSFGIQSMKARVESVGGELHFISEVGKGTTVSGWVPAAE